MRVYEVDKVQALFCGLINQFKDDGCVMGEFAASSAELIRDYTTKKLEVVEAEPVCLENRTLKHYDPDISYGTHTVRVTFILYDYVGRIAYRVGGNCKGGDLLNADFLGEHSQDEIKNYVENDCSFAFNEDYETYSLILTNSNGERLETDGEASVIRDMVAKVEIVDFVAKDIPEVD